MTDKGVTVVWWVVACGPGGGQRGEAASLGDVPAWLGDSVLAKTWGNPVCGDAQCTVGCCMLKPVLKALVLAITKI